jgi:hypothetical protein
VIVGEEGQMGRRPIRGERARLQERETLRSRVELVERPTGGKDERGELRREALIHLLWRESPRGRKSPGEQRFRPELTAWGQKGARLFRWEQAVGAPGEGWRGFHRERGSGEGSRRLDSDHLRGGKLWRAKPRSVGS